MTTHVQDWDILKVARMALLHPDYLQTIKMSYCCTWVVTSTWSAPIESADKQNPPIWLPFVCCRNLEKLKPCLLSKRRHRSNRKDRRDLREKRDRGETEKRKGRERNDRKHFFHTVVCRLQEEKSIGDNFAVQEVLSCATMWVEASRLHTEEFQFF